MAVLATMLAPVATEAQTVRGVVIEDSTDAPIASVRVELLAAGGGTAAAAETNAAGMFVLRAPRAGRFVLRVAHLGYGAVSSDTLQLRADDGLVVEARLTPAAIPIKPIVVVARGSSRLDGFYERMRRPGSGQFLTRAELEARPGAQVTDVLRGMRGVDILEVRAGGFTAAGTTQLISVRGGPSCRRRWSMVRSRRTARARRSPAWAWSCSNAAESALPWSKRTRRPESQGSPWSWKKLVAGAGAFALVVSLTR